MRGRLKTVQIEGSTLCNARCGFCPHGTMTRKHGVMDIGLFSKIVDEAKAVGVGRILPFLNGEPFMDPLIFERLDCIQSAGLRTKIFTNASLLDNATVDRLVRYDNIDGVRCSLNAASDAVYTSVMNGPDYETTVANIRNLISKARFKVRVSMTVVDKNRHEVGRFRKTWGRTGILNDFFNWGGQWSDRLEKTGTRVRCYQLLDRLSVLWDGTVCLCCFDYEGATVIGDMKKHTVEEAWKRFRRYRVQNRDLVFFNPLCKNCNVNALKQTYLRGNGNEAIGSDQRVQQFRDSEKATPAFQEDGASL